MTEPSSHVNTLILALGSNKDDRAYFLKRAIQELKAVLHSDIDCGSVYESPALLKDNSPPEWDQPFLNTVIACESAHSTSEILQHCQSIERKLGREKDHPVWSPREIDIDILFHGEQYITGDALTVPHSAITERLFVLYPLKSLENHLWQPLWDAHFSTPIDEHIRTLEQSSHTPLPTLYTGAVA